MSAPGTEQTTIRRYHYSSLAERDGRPSCSQKVRVQALVSASICLCALEQDAESLPAPGVFDPSAEGSGVRDNFPCRDQ